MKKRNFTLVELLVVIAIIGILAGILLPTLGMIRNNAKQKQALTEAKSIQTAIRSFYTDYSYLPGAPDTKGNDVVYSATKKDNPDNNHDQVKNDTLSEYAALDADYLKLFDILCSSNTAAATPASTPSDDSKKRNPKKISYLSPMKNYLSSDATQKGYRDPWGRPYIVYLDTSYDKKIYVDSCFKVPSDLINDIAAVISLGANSASKVSDACKGTSNLKDLATTWQ